MKLGHGLLYKSVTQQSSLWVGSGEQMRKESSKVWTSFHVCIRVQFVDTTAKMENNAAIEEIIVKMKY